MWKYFSLIDNVKRIINTACIVLMYKEQFLQAFLPSITSLIFVLIIARFRPYEQKTDNIKRLITEFTLFSCYTLISLFGLNGLKWLRDEDSCLIYGWIIIGICIICMILHLTIDLNTKLSANKLFIERLWHKLLGRNKT